MLICTEKWYQKLFMGEGVITNGVSKERRGAKSLAPLRSFEIQYVACQNRLLVFPALRTY